MIFHNELPLTEQASTGGRVSSWSVRCTSAVRSCLARTHMSCLPSTHMSCLPRTHVSCLPRTHVSCLPRTHMSCLPRTHMSCLSRTRMGPGAWAHKGTQKSRFSKVLRMCHPIVENTATPWDPWGSVVPSLGPYGEKSKKSANVSKHPDFLGVS